VSEYDDVVDEPYQPGRAEDSEFVPPAELSRYSNWTREQAIAHGRAVGEDEMRLRRETGEVAEQRIRRAMAYAAWEYDGKPESGAAQRKEFGVAETSVTASLERAVFGRLLKKGKP